MTSTQSGNDTLPVVAITGATGLIGSALSASLRADGYRVRRMVRSAHGSTPDDIRWSPTEGTIEAGALEGVHAVVNLAGEPIAQRWTRERKQAIRESRVRGTQTLARAIASLESRPSVVLSGSAVGHYGDRGDEILDESSSPGTDFLAAVTREWEGAAQPIADAGVRLVILRSGIVLSKAGGALAKMLLPFQLGVGGPLGSGRQWMSWISLHDHVRAMRFAIDNANVRGALNLTSPQPVQNEEFVHTLGRALHRPAILPVPAFVLELMYGEMAEQTILVGQRVLPRALESAGFKFDDPTLAEALKRALVERQE